MGALIYGQSEVWIAKDLQLASEVGESLMGLRALSLRSLLTWNSVRNELLDTHLVSGESENWLLVLGNIPVP